jgi:FemAB-related protein (PEP-CTERM system-associated)
MSALEIKQLSETDHQRWDEFVRSAPDGTFYHLSGWKTLIEGELRHAAYYLYCEREGSLVGVLPLVRVKSWLFGDALISVPFLVYGGPLAGDEASLQELVAAARDLAEDLGVDYLELRNREPLAGDWHTNDINVTFRKPISADPEENLLAIPRKQRAVIRKGIKAGLTAEQDVDAARLYAALLPCKRNLGTPFFGRRWLETIKNEFGDDAEITTVTHGSKLVCSVMSFRFRNEILPYYGGGDDIARDLKGNDYMYWAVMERACKAGVEIFDYGRSKVGSGAYRFKKHWGFEPEPLYYQCHLVRAASIPNISQTNPKFDMLVAAWRRLPLGVAGTVGPPLARRLA